MSRLTAEPDLADTPVIHVHAGLPKTGSSALQRFLVLNGGRLRAAGVLVPETGQAEGGAHHPLMFDLAGLNPLVRGAALNDLEQEIRDSGADQVLISSEFLYGVLRWGFAGRALRRLARRGFRLRVHMFVRPQTDFAVSAYPEFLRNMVAGVRFPVFVETNFLPYAGDYREIAAVMARGTGAEVTYLPYNAAARREGVWWSLLDGIGVEADPEGFEAPGEVNRSLGPAGVSALTQALMRIEREGMVARWGHRKSVRLALLYATHRLRPEEARFNPLTPNRRRRLWEQCGPANEALARAAWGRPWDEVFAEERGQLPEKCIFRREEASPEMAEHHAWMVRHLYRTARRKIAAVEANAAEHGAGRRLRRLIGRPVDRLADRVMRAMVRGR